LSNELINFLDVWFDFIHLDVVVVVVVVVVYDLFWIPIVCKRQTGMNVNKQIL
jgi:hypothetical protein